MHSSQSVHVVRFTAVLPALLLAIVTASAGCRGGEIKVAAPFGSGWSATHADAANSDFAQVGGPRDLQLAWSRKFAGTINLGATSDREGRIFITTSADGCHLYVLDHETGDTVWCSKAVTKQAVASSALLDVQGRVYLADNVAMHAFSPDGALLWEVPIEGIPLSAQFTKEGRLIFMTHIGRLYVLDRETGKPMIALVNLAPSLTYEPSQDITSCMRGTADCPAANVMAMDGDGGFYFTFWEPGSAQAGLRAMKYSETPVPAVTPLWSNNTLPGGSGSSPDLSADGKRIYVNDNDGALHAIDAATGRNIWSFTLGYQTGGSQSTSPEGLIMPAGGGDAPLMALRDRGDHAEVVWRNDEFLNHGIPTQALGSVAYATELVGQAAHDLVVIDTKSGSELDREHLPGKTLFSVGTTLDLNGYVYVPTFNGHLFAFRPAGKSGR
jgi:outer membrane protein assembly factor BamB